MDPSKPENPKPPDIAAASVPDTLAALHVNPDTGLTQSEVDASRRGYSPSCSGSNRSNSRAVHGDLGLLSRVCQFDQSRTVHKS